jgi:site-specific DNA-methyltransferase (cytosine-N4-specific)
MNALLKNGYKAKVRPSGHCISDKFMVQHEGSIPPNILALPNTESNSHYLTYCTEHELPQHPARFPSGLPEFFIQMCTDKNDLVIDPFAGSCVTGEVCERLKRHWICCETEEKYIKGALGRFEDHKENEIMYDNMSYSIYKPGFTWSLNDKTKLDINGGASRTKCITSLSISGNNHERIPVKLAALPSSRGK